MEEIELTSTYKAIQKSIESVPFHKGFGQKFSEYLKQWNHIKEQLWIIFIKLSQKNFQNLTFKSWFFKIFRGEVLFLSVVKLSHDSFI